jgi:hypothetical protein
MSGGRHDDLLAIRAGDVAVAVAPSWARYPVRPSPVDRCGLVRTSCRWWR